MYVVKLAIAVFALVFCSSSAGLASALGDSAQNFTVLGHETVTNGHSGPNPATQISGNLGVTPGTSVTGFSPTGTVSGGTIHIDDGAAQSALANATTTYNGLAAMPYTSDLTGQDLGGLTLSPGVYHFNTSAQLTGSLALDFTGNAGSNFIFQIGSTLTTASGSSVNVSNGSSLSGVYWQVGSSATLGTGTIFAGNILALDSVTLAPQADILCGRAFALTGAVTLIDNLISNNNAVKDFGSYGFSNGFHSPTVVPEPVSVLLFGLGGVSMACVRSRRKA